MDTTELLKNNIPNRTWENTYTTKVFIVHLIQIERSVLYLMWHPQMRIKLGLKPTSPTAAAVCEQALGCAVYHPLPLQERVISYGHETLAGAKAEKAKSSCKDSTPHSSMTPPGETRTLQSHPEARPWSRAPGGQALLLPNLEKQGRGSGWAESGADNRS